ncbi:MAG: ABC transporter permease subunit [Eubacteriales bacterium]|nr:ABC transporter permease subunit [Eubacteriales bacterium]
MSADPVHGILRRELRLWRVFRRDYQLWIFLLPALAAIIVFNYLPMYGIQLAFREYSFKAGITGGDWVGLKYFEKYVNSPMFGLTIKNTFTIASMSILLGFPAPILLALLFNQIRSPRYKNVLQTTVYMPHFISTVVMVSLLHVFLSMNSGLLTSVLKSLGLLTEKANPIGDPGSFVWVYVLSGIWQNCGWDSIIYLAALSAVDSNLYEACRIDGANRLQIIRHIDIPAITPTIVILLVLNCGNILNVGFEKVYLMQNSVNLSTSQVISTYVFNVGLKNSNQFSFGSAIGLFNTLINFVFLVLVNLISRRVADISIW